MIIINSLDTHLKYKQILLDAIHKFTLDNDTRLSPLQTNIHSTKGELLIGEPSAVHSDYFIPKNVNREYLTTFYSDDVIRPVVVNIGHALGLNPFDYHIHNTWFQQYDNTGEHALHNHPGCHFTNCYYLELPDSEYKTELIGLEGEPLEFIVKEGDVMTCPAWMLHRSKPNGSGRKTVIAFNTSYNHTKTY
jgi:hypothetical protein|tara:strand:- start:49 stop:621 length:573 start_codon:yes stop_codon:yes gene_type:complete